MGAPAGNTNRATQYRLQREIEDALRGESKSESLDELRLILRAQVSKAKEGDTQAFRELMDRWAGRPAQALAVTGEDGGPVQLQAVEWNIVPPKT